MRLVITMAKIYCKLYKLHETYDKQVVHICNFKSNILNCISILDLNNLNTFEKSLINTEFQLCHTGIIMV